MSDNMVSRLAMRIYMVHLCSPEKNKQNKVSYIDRQRASLGKYTEYLCWVRRLRIWMWVHTSLRGSHSTWITHTHRSTCKILVLYVFFLSFFSTYISSSNTYACCRRSSMWRVLRWETSWWIVLGSPNNIPLVFRWLHPTKPRRCCTHSARHGILFPFPFRASLCCFSPDRLRCAVQARLCHKCCRHVIGLGPYRLPMTSYPSP